MTCAKKKYTTIAAAISALRKAQKSGKKYRREKRFYWCKSCEAYHLTHQEDKNKP